MGNCWRIYERRLSRVGTVLYAVANQSVSRSDDCSATQLNFELQFPIKININKNMPTFIRNLQLYSLHTGLQSLQPYSWDNFLPLLSDSPQTFFWGKFPISLDDEVGAYLNFDGYYFRFEEVLSSFYQSSLPRRGGFKVFGLQWMESFTNGKSLMIIWLIVIQLMVIWCLLVHRIPPVVLCVIVKDEHYWAVLTNPLHTSSVRSSKIAFIRLGLMDH